MKLLYKSLLFLMIFICSVGSVCATDPNNTTINNVTATDLDNSLNESNNLANTNNHVINLNHNTHLKSIIKDLNEIYNISETLKNIILTK